MKNHPPKSCKQKRASLKAKRLADKAKKQYRSRTQRSVMLGQNTMPVDCGKLNFGTSYDAPDFAVRGFYRDENFICVDCGSEELWTASDQKWWYETVQGFVWTHAIRCDQCRYKERVRKNQARSAHAKGLAAAGRKVPETLQAYL